VPVPGDGNSVPGGDGRYQPQNGGQLPEDDDDLLVRPYTVTGGRTKPRSHLEVEAMVSASYYRASDLAGLNPECRAILALCRDWRSVAEVSAILAMPLGVARILITDLAAEGLVRIQQLSHERGRPDVNLLERVLSGIRRL
jgi:hypothetical protein